MKRVVVGVLVYASYAYGMGRYGDGYRTPNPVVEERTLPSKAASMIDLRYGVEGRSARRFPLDEQTERKYEIYDLEAKIFKTIHTLRCRQQILREACQAIWHKKGSHDWQFDKLDEFATSFETRSTYIVDLANTIRSTHFCDKGWCERRKDELLENLTEFCTMGDILEKYLAVLQQQ